MTLSLAEGTGGLAEAGLAPLSDALARSGPEWLSKHRKSSLEAFAVSGVPNSRDEEWKYTSVRSLEEGKWEVCSPTIVKGSEEGPFLQPGSLRISIADGVCTRKPGDLPVGLTVRSITEPGSEAEALFGHSHSGTTQAGDRTVSPDYYTFGELNTAVFPEGTVIWIAAGAKIEPVIEIVHRLTGSQNGVRSLTFPRLMIVAEEGSSARIVETYVSDSSADGTAMPVTEVFVRKGAKLEHVRVQDQSETSVHIGLWQTRQAGDSEYNSTNVCLGGATARVDQTIWLEGEQAVTRLDGVVCAKGGQHIDNHTRLDHAVPECNSFEIYKQIVSDKATVVFNGKIFVHQDAQKSDAKQTNQALLLSPTATIDSKPQLEIFADDVKCTHGATVGQLEDTALFYMRQRGVPEDTAKAVLVYAFAAEVLELITIDDVRKALEQKLYQKLGVDLS